MKLVELMNDIFIETDTIKLGDLYLRICKSQTVLLYGKESIFIGRFTIGTIPHELFDRKVTWIDADYSGNLKIYIKY